MTLIEQIVEGLPDLSQRELMEIANRVFRLSPTLQQKRADMLRRTHGVLSEEDGEAFENALKESRRVEDHG